MSTWVYKKTATPWRTDNNHDDSFNGRRRNKIPSASEARLVEIEPPQPIVLETEQMECRQPKTARLRVVDRRQAIKRSLSEPETRVRDRWFEQINDGGGYLNGSKKPFMTSSSQASTVPLDKRLSLLTTTTQDSYDALSLPNQPMSIEQQSGQLSITCSSCRARNVWRQIGPEFEPSGHIWEATSRPGGHHNDSADHYFTANNSHSNQTGDQSLDQQSYPTDATGRQQSMRDADNQDYLIRTLALQRSHLTRSERRRGEFGDEFIPLPPTIDSNDPPPPPSAGEDEDYARLVATIRRGCHFCSIECDRYNFVPQPGQDWCYALSLSQSDKMNPDNASLECGRYIVVDRNVHYASFLRIFQGIPLNMVMNLTFFTFCLIVNRILTYLLPEMYARYTEYDMEKAFMNSLVKTKKRLRDVLSGKCFTFLRMSNSDFIKRAGLDGMAYLVVIRSTLLQFVAMTPYLLLVLPFYALKPSESSLFARLTINSVRSDDDADFTFLFSVNAVSTLLFFILTFLRFNTARRWLTYYDLSGAWKDPENQGDSRSAITLGDQDPDNASDEDQPTSSNTSDYNSNHVNQIPNVLMLFGVPFTSPDELLQRLKVHFEQYWLALLAYNRRYAQQRGRELEVGCPLTPQSLMPCIKPVSASEVYNDQIYELERLIQCELPDVNALLYRQGDDVRKSAWSGLVFVGLKSAEAAFKIAVHSNVTPNLTIPINYTVHRQAYFGVCGVVSRVVSLRPVNGVKRPFVWLKLAPLPTDILWHNMTEPHYRKAVWWCKLFVIRVCVFLAALTFTSPVYLFIFMDAVGATRWIDSQHWLFAHKWLPAFVLASAGWLVELLVAATEYYWVEHGTYGMREKTGQRSLFAFLFITIVLFPSIGIAGLPSLINFFPRLFNSIISNPSGKPFDVDCMFRPDNGGLFIHYVINCSFLSVGFHLLKLGPLSLYLMQKWFTSRSEAELKYTLHYSAWPFPFSHRYATLMLVHVLVIAYAPICPIILLFGLIFYLLRFMGDKYALVNLYASYPFEARVRPKQHWAQARRIYHVSWFLQSTYTSMTGICMANLNLLWYFAYHPGRPQTLRPSLCFLATSISTIILALTLSILAATRLLPLIGCRGDKATRRGAVRQQVSHGGDD